MKQVVFIRHGQSTWNLANRFTGWTDVDLSERGVEEARQAGIALKTAGYDFDIAFTSYLKRAIRTLWLIQEVMDLMWIPVDTDWRLNERHYGSLQGLNKKQTVEKHGADQVKQWRRGFAIRPPAVDVQDERHPAHDRRYRHLPQLPGSESLADTLERVVPYWLEKIVPPLKSGSKPIVVAHGNSLRALVKYLDDMAEDEVMGLNIPTGIPLIYEFDDTLRPTNHFYLADDDKLASAVTEVANQTATK
ncbi:MAG: 2,3-diphosphoglycerate-dependent phosphoglycerate mutase [Gammaproteobacteria bacterium]|nr:2,3-diphosphoglycerate-dependent phosphoglycerate mutase [Gammaproteobacteria bacterium]